MTVDARLYLFDDDRARAWHPFVLTRPAGELLHGALLQRERAERALRTPCTGHLVGEALTGFREEGAPPVTSLAEVGTEGPRVLLSSRAVPERPEEALDLSVSATLTIQGEPVGWVLPDGAELPDPDALLDPTSAGGRDADVALEGEVAEWPWDLVARNAERLRRDLDALHRGGDSFLLSGVETVGDHVVSLGEGATVEPGVIFDLREGPVRLESGARVEAPARLAGPAWIGRDTTVLGGSLTAVSIGPVCKVRGEVDSSVLLGWDNKAHDGYLGHAYLGRWVNLGAMTTNSDLKNSYSPVRVPIDPDREVDTGRLKVGTFLGDHVKTGIGTLLDTGSVVGAGSNVFGGGLAPRRVPPFSWGPGSAGGELGEYRLEKFLEVAASAMARRGVELDEAGRALLERAWERSRSER